MKTKHLLLTEALALGALGASAQTTWYVDLNSTSPSPNGLSWRHSFPTVQEALDSATNDDVIRVADGSYFRDGSDQDLSFVISDAITLIGGFPGLSDTTVTTPNPVTYQTILTGEINSVALLTDNTERIVKIDVNFSGNIVIDGFYIQYGYADGSGDDEKGAAVWFKNQGTGSLTISDCVLRYNHADVAGGAVFVADGTLIISNSTLNDNTCLVEGGALYSAAGHDITLNTCTLTDNTVGTALTTDLGGAIFASGSGTDLDVNDSYFEDNTANRGSAIYLVSSATLDLDNTDFNSNGTASVGKGGALYMDNSASLTTSGDASSFTSNLANYGGAICMESTTTACSLNMIGTIFTSNATGDQGGAIFVDDLSSFAIDGASFTSNTADGLGGVVYASAPASTKKEMLFENTTFTSNSTTGGFDGGVFFLNQYIELTIRKCEAIGNTAADDGGFIYNKQNSDVLIGNLVARGNTAADGGVFAAETSSALFKIANLEATCNDVTGEGNIYFSAITSGSSLPVMEMFFATLYDNSTGTGSMFYGKATSSQFAGQGYVESTIERNNVNTAFANLDGNPEDYTYSYSMICGSGGQSRTANVSCTDPIFEAGDGESCADYDLRLNSTPGTISPLIDVAVACTTGQVPVSPEDFADVDDDGNTSELLPIDLDMNARCVDHSSVSGDAADMGAYENDESYKGNESIVGSGYNTGTVYPNPTADRITISLDNTVKQVLLFNISGQLQLAQVEFNGSQAQVDMSALAPGIYFVKVNDGIQSYNYKVEKL